MTNETGIAKAVRLAGSQTNIANVLGLTPQAIQKWVENGCLPRTEWTGETTYAKQIAEHLDNKVTAEEILKRPACAA